MAVCIILQIFQDTSKDSIMATLNSILTQDRENINKEIVHIYLWYMSSCQEITSFNNIELKSLIQNHNIKVDLIQSKSGFFDDLNFSLNYIEQLNVTSILHCTAGIVFQASFLSFLFQKREEYKEGQISHSILTSRGIRLFPHYKCRSPLQNGVHYKLYTQNPSDRAVHVFTPHLCLVDKDLLFKLIDSKSWKNTIKYYKNCGNTNLGTFWLSYVMSCEFNTCIWKINTSGVVIDSPHFCSDSQSSSYDSLDGILKEESFRVFYDFIYSHDWPLGISQPLYTNSTEIQQAIGTTDTTGIQETIGPTNSTTCTNTCHQTQDTFNTTSTTSDSLITTTNSTEIQDTFNTTNTTSDSLITTTNSTEIQDTLSTTNSTETITTKSIETKDTLSTTRSTTILTPRELWDRGFGGVNMSSEPASELDFASISSYYGVKVIRIGAVADAQDLNYLINPTAQTTQDDYKHLLHVLPRLRKAISKVSSFGLKVVVTATDLPGAWFQSGSCDEFWHSQDVRVRCAKFWGYLSKHLVDLSESIMGYDLINEPHSPDDGEYLDDVFYKYSPQLHHFYNEAIKEIRTFDCKVMIILNPLGYSNPLQMQTLNPTLLPSDDPNLSFSFHMYALPRLTLRVFRNKIHPPPVYPGLLQKWMNCPYDFVDVNCDFIRSVLNNVKKWQNQYWIPSNRILIGEFGISREIPGSREYLENLVEIFQEYGWNWLLFSFRDEEWDSMDYELGMDFNNMLHRTPNELFMTVANHFH